MTAFFLRTVYIPVALRYVAGAAFAACPALVVRVAFGDRA